jgi:hypothetical protein
MDDKDRPKEELINEVRALRQKVSALEAYLALNRKEKTCSKHL